MTKNHPMEMDKTLLLCFLMFCVNTVTGVNLVQLQNLKVDMLEGEMMAHWKHPEDTRSNYKYNVQMAMYTGEWKPVDSCTGITVNFCDLSSLIEDYITVYKVRVQMVAGNDKSPWTSKKFLPNESKLQPPSFTIWATSTTLSVHVHEKPILKKLFLYGSFFTIYLEEKGVDNKNTTAYLDDDEEEDKRRKTFSALHWGSVYCISIKVESKANPSSSSVSDKQCLQLPQDEWFMSAVTSMSTLGALACTVVAAVLFRCYLRRPGKTPAALKSPISGWVPLTVGEATMESVTDKGWFLSSYKSTEVKNTLKVPVTHVTVTEDNGEEDRRTSTDSGVSMASRSAINSRTTPQKTQEDSGCGSLGGSETSTSGQTEYPLQGEQSDCGVTRKREDSGVGLGCQLHSSSNNLDAPDSGFLKEAVAGNYRSQSPSTVHINICDEEEAFKEMLSDSVLAEVVTGYRAGPQSCICSGAGQCTWCLNQGLYGTAVIKQYRAMCPDSTLLSGKCDSYKGRTFSSYSKKSQLDTLVMDDLDTTFTQLSENFPLLTALTPLTMMQREQDVNMNSVPLSLCDVQLTSD
ncbi:uncharacterized protein V6R79_022353 [Siganus canaliculatus]